MKKSIYETLLIEEFENARDLMLANERLSDKISALCLKKTLKNLLI